MLASKSQDDLEISLNDLSLLLNDQDWESADRLTADLLWLAVEQDLYSRETQLHQRGHSDRDRFTTATLADMPCQLLHALDDRWQVASGGQFGFSAQLQIYHEVLATVEFDPSLRNWLNPHPFFVKVNWLMPLPLRPVGFLKFYNWLEFDLDAPKGHLPALWYWQVPGLYSLRMGGFLTGQGAAFGDLARLDAMLLRLARCHQLE